MGFFDKLRQGMNKTKQSFDEKLNNVFKSFRKVDEEFLEELEEILIMSDIGIDTSMKIINNLREKIKKEKIQDEEDVKKALRQEMQEILDITDKNLHADFQVIDADKVLTVPIKVQLGGNPAGVREGGNLQKGIDTIKISCLPKDLPVRIIADISDLKIGDKMAVKQIALPEGVKVVSNGDAVIATIKAPRR